MRCTVVPREKFKSAVELLVEGYIVAIPEKENGVIPKKGNGLLEYKKINKSVKEESIADRIISAIDCDELPYKSPKEFLFPQIEELIIFDDNCCKAVEEENGEKIAIVGIKPCDLNALKVLLAVFSQGKYKDEKVARRRENVILIGTGCTEKKPGCFCDERGIDKSFSRECDIFIKKPVDENESYRFYSFTVNGDNILDKLVRDCFISYKKEEVNEISDNPVQIIDGIPAREYEPVCEQCKGNESPKKELVIEADENALFDKADWKGISEKCLGCGICTYICPTCHCFDFRDIFAGGKTIRYRCWDSCMYPKFTLHASGHNPRTSKKERFRQRVLHKYVYVKKNFGYIACTGCGRCIRSCPAGMNIRNVVHEISRIKV